MLSYSQTVLVAASHEGEVLCLDCFKSWLSNETDVPEEDIDLGAMRVWLSTDSAREDGWYGIIEYVMSSEYNSDGLGVYCNQCGEELSPPYCIECGENKPGMVDYGDGVLYCPECAVELGYLVLDVADALAPSSDDYCATSPDPIQYECSECPDRNLCNAYAITHGEE